MSKITESDLRWLAGVLEATGKFSVRTRNRKEYLGLYFGGRQEILQVISKIIMCPIRWSAANEYDRRGCAHHCPEAHVHIKRNVHACIDAEGTQAHIIVWNLLPYLRARRDEADAVLSRLNFPDVSRSKILERIETMVDKGWQIPDA